MTALFVIGCIIADILLSVYCGGINHRIQNRRCNSYRHYYAGCSHATAIVFGYPFWFVILPASFFYELAVGRAGAAERVRLSHAEKRVQRERQKQVLAAEQEKTLAAQKRLLEIRLDIDRLTDIATDGVRQFPRKDFEKS